MTDEREEAVSADSELEEYHLKLRNLRLSDYPDVQRIMDTVYASLGGPGRSSSSPPRSVVSPKARSASRTTAAWSPSRSR